MKKSITFKDPETGKDYELMYTIASLSKVERRLGRSLMYLIKAVLSGARSLNLVTIDFTIDSVEEGLQNKPAGFSGADFVSDYCAKGGDLDTLNWYILQAMILTGLFTTGTVQDAEAMLDGLNKLVPKA